MRGSSVQDFLPYHLKNKSRSIQRGKSEEPEDTYVHLCAPALIARLRVSRVIEYRLPYPPISASTGMGIGGSSRISAGVFLVDFILLAAGVLGAGVLGAGVLGTGI